MSDGNTENTVDPNTDNLEDFTALFEGKAKPAEAPTETIEDTQPQEDESNPAEDSSEPETNDTDEPSQEAEPEENTDNEEEDLGEHDDGKPRLSGKKKSFQDRIDEITAARREAEREAEELRQRIAALEAAPKSPQKETAPTPNNAPDPDALAENGERLYPLGEYDPNYINALHEYNFEIRWTQAREQERAEQQRQLQQAAQQELISTWESKLVETEQEIPDIRQKGERLGSVFEGVDQQYAEFIATTIMTLDNGPKVVAYLSDNPTEARKIVASGPVGATLAIGRIDAQFATPRDKPPVKSTNAPEPPPQLNKGRDGRVKVAGDTDDLEAFEKAFFK